MAVVTSVASAGMQAWSLVSAPGALAGAALLADLVTREESRLSATGGGAVVPGGRVVDHAEVQSVDPVPQVHGQDQLPAEVVAEEADVGVGEVHPWNHEDNADGGKDGAEEQALERIAECGRAPPQERVDRDGEHEREDDPVDVVEDAAGQELHVLRRLRRVDRAVDPVPVQLRESDAGHEVTDHGGQVRGNEASQQCGTYPVIAHPGPVPIDGLLTCRVTGSILAY